MNGLTPIVVLFQDLLGELARVAHALELAHDHAVRGAAFARDGKPFSQRFDDAFQLFFHPAILPHPGG